MEYLVARKFHRLLIAQVETYHGTMLEFTEILRATHSFTYVCRSSLPVAMEVVGRPESNGLEGWPNILAI
ncbi:unnamed protein product [Staurois parvus]|uniref:Uncharacterized protein n=1 Tax=Staurois parvus TaxID=386267 RepID=A0ABN9GJT6_9NEOB|nr:unnamed protein product [Staurois parvus]